MENKNEKEIERGNGMLKTLMLKRSIDMKKRELEQLREKDIDFETREAELTAAIDEAETEEQQDAVSEEIEKYETEKEEHDNAKAALEEEINGLEAELKEIEELAPTRARRNEVKNERRTEMNIRTAIRNAEKGVRALDVLSIETRNAIMDQDDVKTFISQIREAGRNKRDLEGGGLTIPVVFLDLIAENMYRYSKLINRVRLRTVRGEARQTIAGLVPEAIWTEMCGAINELTFTFSQMTFDGYKVAGYIPVCNSLLEDSDIELASWIVEMLSESIGYAVDKAILYGKGANSNMPLGIVTRLAQTSAPQGYPATAPAWVDLSETNLLSIPSATTGAAFWSALVTATSAIANRYARGNKFWCMNSKTLAALQSKAITFTATGAIVAGVSDTLPVITGDIDVLEFMPDGDIVGGYGDLYLWVQRSGMQVEYDRSVQFIQDNTVFRGKERADGAPIIPQAFVAININGTDPTTEMAFAGDTANNASLNGLTIGTYSLTPSFDPTVLSYAVTATNASDAVTATPTIAGAQVTISYNGANVKNGSSVKWKTGANPMTITVTNGNAKIVYTVTVTYSAD